MNPGKDSEPVCSPLPLTGRLQQVRLLNNGHPFSTVERCPNPTATKRRGREAARLLRTLNQRQYGHPLHGCRLILLADGPVDG